MPVNNCLNSANIARFHARPDKPQWFIINYPIQMHTHPSSTFVRFAWASLMFLAFNTLSFAQNRVLVFSKTAVFRHTSIGVGKNAIAKLGAENGFVVDTTENAAMFNEQNLRRYAAVVFLNTTGDVLDPLQQNAFERYIQAGGGYVGVHAATDTEYDWPWYGKLAGAYFKDHPSTPSNVQHGVYHVHDKTHASTSFLPEPWERTDEFYSFKNMNPDVKVLLTLDEKSYIGGNMGDWHPSAWYHEYDGGRAFYTSLGHTEETYAEPLFLRHLLEGLKWAMNGKLDYSKVHTPLMPEENRFTKVILQEKLDEPMELTTLGNGRVLFIQRKGEVRLYDPKNGLRTIATIPVSTKYKSKEGKESEAEDGLLGLSKDPNFAQNHWIYLYYSPAGDEAKNILTRYELRGDELVMSSKKVLLEIPVQREECCHTGGSIAWDASGNLFLSTGDNSSPRADGYSPIDERPERGPWDAQKSSANTNDLRGKIIRIHPQADGTYTIPDGNLFAKGTPKTRPEIYTMGHRNPFRISVDPKTGFVYWGEVGPDASKPDSTRGPQGYDEVGQARKAGNYGWPYFVADNQAYRDYNYADKTSGDYYQVDKPLNQSPNNTGLEVLPPAQKAFVWYPYDASKEFPLVGTGGRNAMAGPVFHKNDFGNAARVFPEYYDGKLLIYDWMRGWVMAVTMDQTGNFVSMERFMPSEKFSNPMDMEFDENGDLWMLEYGTGWFQGNDDARLLRIEYSAGNRKPQAQVSADRTAGSLPLTVQLSSEGTKDFDGDALQYEWKIAPASGGKTQIFKTANATVTLKKKGVYNATLTVTDPSGLSNTRSLELVAGNEPPKVALELGEGTNRSFFFPNQKINYAVKVNDKEDGSLAAGTIGSDAVVFTADYLAEGYDKEAIARGHRDADASAVLAPGAKLMAGSDCQACHFPDKKSIGPEYRLVAQKYKDQADAVPMLAKKIISGGNGVWGDVAMAAHPQIKLEDAEEIARYILSMSDVKPRLAPEGELIASVPEGDQGQGVYLLRAAYKDRGAMGLPGQMSEQVYVLRNPAVGAHDADKYDNVQKMTFGGSKLLIPNSSGAYVMLQQIDLTGVAQIDFTVLAPKAMMNAAGGIIEVRLDAVNGPLAGQTQLIVPSEKEGFAADLAVAPLNGQSGMHDIYLIFKNDQAPAGQSLFVMTGIKFQTEAMLAAAAAEAAKPATSKNPLEDYVGKFKFTGLPFPYITFTVADGALVSDTGTDKGPIKPTATADRFDANGQAMFQFVRTDGKVTSVKLEAMGMTFEGVKE